MLRRIKKNIVALVLTGLCVGFLSLSQIYEQTHYVDLQNKTRIDKKSGLSVVDYKVNSQVVRDSSYFPMQIGKQWIFVSQSDTLIETIVDTQRIGENLYYSFDQFRHSSGYLFRTFENQVFLYIDTTEYLFYNFGADSGDRWLAPAEPFLPLHQVWCFLLSKTDTVVTPVGTFTNCYVLDHFIAFDYEFVEWFAPGIGIVQRDVITIAGQKRWTLTDTMITSVRNKSKSYIPKTFFLSHNYPNPFNQETVIEYELRGTIFINLRVYNLLGNKVVTLVNEKQTTGRHQVVWNGTDKYGKKVSSGIYFYQLKTDVFCQTRKMCLMR